MLITKNKLPGYDVLKKIYLNSKNVLSAIVINFSLFDVYNSLLHNERNKQVISFCLFGNSSKYFSNIVACIKSYQEIFKGWTIRVYVSRDLPNETLELFKSYNCELIIMNSNGIDYRYTFWRFLVLDDTDVTYAIIRDIDSIASFREKLMVDNWIASGRKMHIIRDHPAHTSLIMAGLWGMYTNNIVQNIKAKMLRFKKLNTFFIDQDFLSKIYHETQPDILVNDIFPRFENEQPQIIPHDNYDFFIGEINSEHPLKHRHKKELADFYKQKRDTDQ